MRRLIRLIPARFRRAARREEGSSTIEFVILFPFFIVLVLSSLEAGLLMVRQVMLERAMDLSVRDLRLGIWQPPTHADLKEQICAQAAIIPDCGNVLMLELRPVSKSSWEPLGSRATCVNRAEPLNPLQFPTFTGGGQNEMMLVRACAKFDPFFPTTGLGLHLPKDNTGAYALIATSAFVNEPE